MQKTFAQQVIIQESVRKDTVYEVSDFECVASHEGYYDCDDRMDMPAERITEKPAQNIVQRIRNILLQNTK